MLVFFAVIVGIISTALKAFVAQTMWLWFVEPSFGIPTPGFVYVCGIIYLLVLVKYDPTKDQSTEANDIVQSMIKSIMHPVMVLIFASTLKILGGV